MKKVYVIIRNCEDDEFNQCGVFQDVVSTKAEAKKMVKRLEDDFLDFKYEILEREIS